MYLRHGRAGGGGGGGRQGRGALPAHASCEPGPGGEGRGRPPHPVSVFAAVSTDEPKHEWMLASSMSSTDSSSKRSQCVCERTSEM